MHSSEGRRAHVVRVLSRCVAGALVIADSRPFPFHTPPRKSPGASPINHLAGSSLCSWRSIGPTARVLTGRRARLMRLGPS